MLPQRRSARRRRRSSRRQSCIHTFPGTHTWGTHTLPWRQPHGCAEGMSPRRSPAWAEPRAVVRSALPDAPSPAAAREVTSVSAKPRAALLMPVRGEAATGDVRTHGEDVGRLAMPAQPASRARVASPAMARSAEPGASAVVVVIGKGSASGAGADAPSRDARGEARRKVCGGDRRRSNDRLRRERRRIRRRPQGPGYRAASPCRPGCR